MCENCEMMRSRERSFDPKLCNETFIFHAVHLSLTLYHIPKSWTHESNRDKVWWKIVGEKNFSPTHFHTFHRHRRSRCCCRVGRRWRHHRSIFPPKIDFSRIISCCPDQREFDVFSSENWLNAAHNFVFYCDSDLLQEKKYCRILMQKSKIKTKNVPLVAWTFFYVRGKNSVSAVDFLPSYNCSLLCTFDEKYRRCRDILFGFISSSLATERHWNYSPTCEGAGGNFPIKMEKFCIIFFMTEILWKSLSCDNNQRNASVIVKMLKQSVDWLAPTSFLLTLWIIQQSAQWGERPLWFHVQTLNAAKHWIHFFGHWVRVGFSYRFSFSFTQMQTVVNL